MKFAKSLLRNEIPEWSPNYIDYKGLKKLVNQVASELSTSNAIAGDTHSPNKVDATVVADQNLDDRTTAPFFFAIDRNVETVDHFYNAKFGEYTRRARHVVQQAASVWKQPSHDDADAAEKEELANMLLELRSNLRNLQWYAEVNKRGFQKILKKFDKKIGTRAQSYYLTSKILVLGFSNGQDIATQVDEINQLLQTIAPQLGDSREGGGWLDPASRALNPHPLLMSAFSSSEVSLTGSLFDSLRAAVDTNDATALNHALTSKELTAKQASVLCLRALTNHADEVIPLLAAYLKKPLQDAHSDVHRRNIVHKAMIAEGRRLVEQNGQRLTEIDAGRSAHQPASKAKTAAMPIAPPPARDEKYARSLAVLLHALAAHTPLAALLGAFDLQLRTPLHYAVRYGLLATARQLLSESSTPLSFADADGHLPVHLAVLYRHPATLSEILRHKCAPQPELLLTAARFGDPEICAALLDCEGYDINVLNSAGETPLHLAVKYGHAATVGLLVSRGADLEARERTYDWTPLFVAAADGASEIAELLLAAGAQADTTDQSGWSPREHAAFRGHITLAKRLPPPKLMAPVVASNKAPPLPTPPSERVANKAADTSTSKLLDPVVPSSLDSRQGGDAHPLKTFGHRYLEHADDHLVLVTLGSRDLRKHNVNPVHLDAVPVSEAGKTQLDTALSLVVSSSTNPSESYPIDLPVSELGLATEPLPFFTSNLHQMQLVFDLVPTYAANNTVLARSVFVLPPKPQITNLNQLLQTVPLVEATTLRVLGTVQFEYLVVSPFVHPQNGLNFSSTYWRSLITTRVIGHRGLGKNTLEHNSLQLGENTVESFIQAANLGASYVEFDVQVTKDNIPVIYHDFLVGDSGFDVPMHAMTYDQFMNIHRPPVERGRRESRPEMPAEKPPSPPVPAAESSLSKPKRSRSVHEYHSGDIPNQYYDDAVQRMRYTRDFRTKGFKGNVRGLHIQSQFATLQELFTTLPAGLGFNIEFKYPMPDEAESEDMYGTVLEINHFVDTILKVIFDNKRERDVILSSFNPDVCALLSLKQPSIPVLFLTEAGTEPMQDIRASSLQEAIRFARRFNLLGIVSGAAPLILCPRLVRAVKENGLVCFTYGTENNVPENARVQLRAGVDAVIVDSVLAIRKELTDPQPNDELANEVERALKNTKV